MKRYFNRPLRIILLVDFLALTSVAMYAPIQAIFVQQIGGDILDAGLASAVVTGQQIHPWLGRQLHRIESTQLMEGKTTNLHGMRQTIRAWR